jgi:DNA-binding Lrp family transcriptional regulator
MLVLIGADREKMPFRIRGDGSQADPFDYRVRHIVRKIIENPRASANEIKTLLAGRVARMTGFKGRDLEEGIFSEIVRLRVDLSPRRDEDGIGTSFIEVFLKKKNQTDKLKFEADIAQVSGVVEWDLVAGDCDYLVRVVGRPHSGLSQGVSDAIEELNAVARTEVSKVQIMRSGVVDNIEPDHFFCIDEDPPSTKT